METLVMHARVMAIAAAVLLVATSAMAAEPVKKPAPQPTKPAVSHSTPVVVLASNDQPTAERVEVSPPVKRRAARVTTCRCGGDPQPAQPEEQ
jgi:hypothetical protein